MQRDNIKTLGVLVWMDSALILLLACFNLWNWCMALSGMSTLEFIGRTSGHTSDKSFDFAFSSTRDNLFKVFGTQSLWGILSPSLRNPAFSGIEWSFYMKDLGFNEFATVWERSSDPEKELQLTELTDIAEEVVKGAE